MRRTLLSKTLGGLYCAALVSLSCGANAEPLGNLPKPADRFEEVAFNLIETVNSLDSVGYRRYFSPKLLVKFSLNEIGGSLRETQEEFGKIESYRIDRSSDGKRGILVLTMKEIVFDAHLRIDKNGKLARDEWYPRFIDPSQGKKLSGPDKAALKARFKPVTDVFVKAFRENDPELLFSIMAQDDPNDSDPLTVEDVAGMISQMRGRGEITGVLDPEFTSGSETVVPMTFGEMEMGFYLTLNKDDRISGLKVTNYAPNENLGKPLKDIGPDTAKTSDLLDFVDLQERFDQDSGKVRFVTLLSPT